MKMLPPQSVFKAHHIGCGKNSAPLRRSDPTAARQAASQHRRSPFACFVPGIRRISGDV
jgi:hypothetical protein